MQRRFSLRCLPRSYVRQVFNFSRLDGNIGSLVNRNDLANDVVTAVVGFIIAAIAGYIGRIKLFTDTVIPTAKKPFSKAVRPLLLAILYFVVCGLDLFWSVIDKAPLTRLGVLQIICWFVMFFFFLCIPRISGGSIFAAPKDG